MSSEFSSEPPPPPLSLADTSAPPPLPPLPPPLPVLPLTFAPQQPPSSLSPLPAPKRRGVSRGFLAAVAIGAVVVLGVGSGTVLLLRDQLTSRPTGWPVETAEGKRRAVLAAFASTNPGATPADIAAVDQLLTSLNQALHGTQSAAGAAMLFDFDRMAEEALAQPGVAGQGMGGPRVVAAQFRATHAAGVAQATGLEPWARHVVRFVQVAPKDGDEAVVYARHWDADGDSRRMRWWVRRKGRTWRVFDWAELSIGYRNTVSVGEAWSTATQRMGANWEATWKHVLDADADLARSDYRAAEARLNKAGGQWLPPQYDAWRWINWSLTHHGLARYDASLAAIGRADAAVPNMPFTDTMRALAYYGMGDYEKALASSRAVEAAIGPDADNLHTIGLSLQQLGRNDEAADAYRRGLDDDPESVENLVSLAAILPAEKKSEVVERFARSSMSREHFDRVTDQIEDAGDDASVQLLLDAYVAKHGRDATSAVYDARLKLRRGDFDAAAAGAKRAMGETTDEAELGALRELYQHAMRRAGKAVGAYRESSDKAGAFRELTEWTTYDDEHPEALRELVEARRADAPDDFWTHYYDGVAHERSLDYPAAEAAYARAAAAIEPGDEDQRERLRGTRVHLRYAQGQALSALAEFPPAARTFGQLAALYADDVDADGLEKLLAAYPVEPRQDPQVRLWQAEVKWLRGDFDAAANGFVEHYALVGAEGSNDDRVVRSLVRARRFGEALPHAKRYERENDEGYYVLLVHAAAGDVVAAGQALETCLKQHYDLEELYADEDLGPLLESPALAPLRAAHPRPASPTTSEAATTVPVEHESDATP